jgi:hypothetical protein
MGILTGNAEDNGIVYSANKYRETDGINDITYLLSNSLVKVLTEKGIISQETIAKEMDDLNTKLFEATKDLLAKEEGQKTTEGAA